MIQVESIIYLKKIEVQTLVDLIKAGASVETLLPAIIGKNNYQLFQIEHPGATIEEFWSFLQQPAIEAAIRVDEHISASQAIIDYLNEKMDLLLNEPDEIQQFGSFLEFPNVGNSKVLYIDIQTDESYRWDIDLLKYYKINDIEIINGGN